MKKLESLFEVDTLNDDMMSEISGGKQVLVWHADCVGQEGEYVSKSIYERYTWNLFRGWVATGEMTESYDTASNCSTN